MHIIFGDSAAQLPDSYTILELDTFRMQSTDELATAYCVIETIPLSEFPLADAHKKIHADLIQAYKNQHWSYCEQAIEGLMGKWNGDLNSFYTDLLQRVINYKENPPESGWDGTLLRLSTD